MKITQQMQNAILAAVELGFKQAEKGSNLEKTLSVARVLYEVNEGPGITEIGFNNSHGDCRSCY